MLPLSKILQPLPEYQALLRHVERNGCCALVGLSQIHRAHILSALADQTSRPLVIICQDDRASDSMAETLSAFLPYTPSVLHTRTLTLPRFTAASHGADQSRLQLLHSFSSGKIPVLIASLEAIALRTMPQAVMRAAAFTISAADQRDIDETVAELVRLGYSRTDMIEGPGQYSVRGGILDIYSPAEPEPVRIEFFGDEIDSMSGFDLTSQRRTEQTEEVLILPTAEALFTLGAGGIDGITAGIDRLISHQKRRKHKNEVLIETLQADRDLIVSQSSQVSADRYLALLYPDFCSAADYFPPDSIVCFSDRMAIVRQESIREEAFGIDLDSLLSNGQIAGDLCDFYTGIDDLLPTFPGSVIYLDNFLSAAYPEILPPEELLTLNVKQLPPYGSSMETGVSDIAHYTESGFGCLVLCGSEQRVHLLARELESQSIPASIHVPLSELPEPGSAALSVGALTSGMEYPMLKFAVITEGQLLSAGSSRRRTRRKSASTNRQKLSTFTDLSPGDLVVHDVHGIGRYVGMEQVRVDGAQKDYLRIAYAGSDVLLLPATQLDCIAKYIGSGDSENTKLHTLGGATWQKTKTRAKASAQKMAAQLIQLYAQRARLPGHAFSPDSPWQNEFEDNFPYAETDDQLRCVEEIKADMEAPTPMDRLLCGDVGYGKTEVALRAAMKCILEGKQCAILVPTTVLAQQHYVTATSRFGGFPINIDVLSRFRSAAEQRVIRHKLETGVIDLIIGTHKLLQNSVRFKDLGLLIVDEEQRFGVTHKERLKEMSQGVDVLTLSATPIPRTLNMALSGLRDMSIIEEPPGNRYPVQTYVLEHDYRILADAIRQEVRRDGQVYYLHNRIDTIYREANRLQALVPGVQFAVAHGRLDKDELSEIMMQMSAGEIQVLVCTTIIETGIDIPNVNTLIIEDADKMGLSQLHQIRGRVGRSSRHAYAYLTFRPGKVLSEDAEKRLSAIREFAEFGSGYKIAMRDLEIRGAGNLLGSEQSGHMIAVGYDMYLKLLEEAILEQRGESAPQEVRCTADLNISANIPETFVPSAEQRMDLYRKIAAIRSEQDSDDVLDEIIDRFGEPPRNVILLLSIAQLRYNASNIGIEEIAQRGRSIVFRFRVINYMAITKMCKDSSMRRHVHFQAGNTPVLKLDLAENANPLKLAQWFISQYTAFCTEEDAPS